MRIWRDSKGALVDDERVLIALASAGGLRNAAHDFDFELVSDSAGSRSVASARCVRPSKAKRLIDYINE